jgi:hypothetical protein
MSKNKTLQERTVNTADSLSNDSEWILLTIRRKELWDEDSHHNDPRSTRKSLKWSPNHAAHFHSHGQEQYWFWWLVSATSENRKEKNTRIRNTNNNTDRWSIFTEGATISCFIALRIEQYSRFTGQEYSRSLATTKSSCVDARNNDQDILSSAATDTGSTLSFWQRATNLRFMLL